MLPPPLLFLLFLLPTPTVPYNILAVAILSGSHTTLTWDFMEVLAEAGHTVTFVVCEKESTGNREHPGIKVFTPTNAWQKTEFDGLKNSCFDPIFAAPGREAEERIFSGGCIEMWDLVLSKQGDVIAGDEVQEILRNEKFHMIIGEKATQSGLETVGHHLGIPIVDLMASHFVTEGAAYGSLPILPFSQLGAFVNDLHRPPTLLEKLSYVPKIFGFIAFMSIGPADRIRSQFGYESSKETHGAVKLFLTNDHVAFTWPYLRPPNSIAVGTARLVGTKNVEPKEFSVELSEFLEEAEDEGKPVVYVGFGSYAEVRKVKWIQPIIRTLDSMGIRTILKVVGSEKEMYFEDSILPMTWVPQMDLLRSGRVQLFISHCGNSGRMESIYFNIPLLCIPIFGDQFTNAAIVVFKEFGKMLHREDIEDKFEDTVKEMLSNRNKYSENMKQASDIADNEPSDGKKSLIFHVEQLCKHGNLDYLTNQLITQQSFIQLNSLDLLGLALVAGLVALVVGLWVAQLVGKVTIWLVKVLSDLFFSEEEKEEKQE